MFKLLRFYSTTSFVIIFVAAALLALFYRQVTLRWIDHLAKTDNMAVAQTALSAVGPELATYLGDMTGSSRSLPDGVATQLYRMTQNTAVDRIRIYARDGALVFSTRAESTAADPDAGAGFRSAIDGDEFTTMLLHDSPLHLATPADTEDLRMRTFTPIRSAPGDAVVGVFETRTDMSHLIEESDRILLSILLGAELILALLYATLFLIVRYAKNILHTQYRTIQERVASLETLSRNLLESDELSRKRLATDLHEGLAQTLSAIKINMESTKLSQSSAAGRQGLESMVPVLQGAIHEVRTLATELRPASLDDLGLLPTLNWFCREFERQHPEIRVRKDITLPEGTIPSHLKVDIYRIIESAFKNIAQHSNTDHIRFVLRLADDMIQLIIGDTPTQPVAASTPSGSGADPQFLFTEMKERTSLSGGEFSVRPEESGGITLCAAWACSK